MHEVELTHAQKEILNAITPIYDDSFVGKMSTMQRKNYRSLMKAREDQEKAFLSDNFRAQNQTAVATLEPPAPEPPLTAPEPPAPAPQATASEPPASVETDIPSTTDESELAYWKAEAEKFKKRHGDATAALSPSQQAAASLRKKLDATERNQEDIASKLLARLEQIEAKISAPVALPQAPMVDPFAGLDQVDPDLSQRLKALEARMKAEVESKTVALERELADYKANAHKSDLETFKTRHDEAVKAAVPEFFEMLKDDGKRKAIMDWMQQQPPAIQAMLSNPYAHTPQDVIFAVRQFERTLSTPPAAKKPSLGDLAGRARQTPLVPDGTPAQDPDLMSQEEVRNISTLLNQANRKGGPSAVNELLAKYERTLKHLASKPRSS